MSCRVVLAARAKVFFSVCIYLKCVYVWVCGYARYMFALDENLRAIYRESNFAHTTLPGSTFDAPLVRRSIQASGNLRFTCCGRYCWGKHSLFRDMFRLHRTCCVLARCYDFATCFAFALLLTCFSFRVETLYFHWCANSLARRRVRLLRHRGCVQIRLQRTNVTLHV